MAILRPHIVKIGNRHYRKLAFEGSQCIDSPNDLNNGGRFLINCSASVMTHGSCV